jgi:3-oxoadipate enol-lactonase
MTNWRTGFAVSDADRIYWESAGTGVPVVICHGAGSNHVSFYQQLAGLAGHDYRLLLWDQRGYGNSTRNSRLLNVRASAADLDAVLADAGLSETPVHLVGQAMGGLIAGSWALAHPGRTLTLALWDGPFELSADGKSLVWTLEPDDRGLAGTLGERHVSRVRALGEAFQDAHPVQAYLYQTIQELGTDRPSYQDSFPAAQSAPMPLDGLRALGVPILLGRGEHDHVVGDAALIELAACLPEATVVTLAGSGHSPYFEVPDAWNAAVRAHLARAVRRD